MPRCAVTTALEHVVRGLRRGACSEARPGAGEEQRHGRGLGPVRAWRGRRPAAGRWRAAAPRRTSVAQDGDVAALGADVPQPERDARGSQAQREDKRPLAARRRHRCLRTAGGPMPPSTPTTRHEPAIAALGTASKRRLSTRIQRPDHAPRRAPPRSRAHAPDRRRSDWPRVTSSAAAARPSDRAQPLPPRARAYRPTVAANATISSGHR